MNSWRNNLARSICNFLLANLATKEYREGLDLAMRLGMAELDRLSKEQPLDRN